MSETPIPTKSVVLNEDFSGSDYLSQTGMPIKVKKFGKKLHSRASTAISTSAGQGKRRQLNVNTLMRKEDGEFDHTSTISQDVQLTSKADMSLGEGFPMNQRA